MRGSPSLPLYAHERTGNGQHSRWPLDETKAFADRRDRQPIGSQRRSRTHAVVNTTPTRPTPHRRFTARAQYVPAVPVLDHRIPPPTYAAGTSPRGRSRSPGGGGGVGGGWQGRRPGFIRSSRRGRARGRPSARASCAPGSACDCCLQRGENGGGGIVRNGER